jgi:hypothetical protein
VESGAGGRLVVELFGARTRLLGPGRSGKMRTGRLVRSSLPAGRVKFIVPLKPVARHALGGGEPLRLTVTATLTAQDGEKFERSRGVAMRSGPPLTGVVK